MSSNESSVLRTLATIYSFFFIFLSVVATSAIQIEGSLNQQEALAFFFISLGLAIACFLIGIEMLNMLDRQGIGRWGTLGVVLIVVLVPLAFSFLVGKVMLPNWQWTVRTPFGELSAPVTISLVSITAIVIILVLIHLLRDE